MTPVGLTITADDKTKLYGAALPALTASYAGFVNGDRAASLTTQPYSQPPPPRPATWHLSVTASGAADPDYTISYVAGSLSVTPVGLTITADQQDEGLRRGAADVDGQLLGLRQWRQQF